MVNFLKKSKISKISTFQKCSKIAFEGVWGPSPDPTWVLWSKYLGFAIFYDIICLKIFFLSKYVILAEIEHPGFGDFANFGDF